MSEKTKQAEPEVQQEGDFKVKKKPKKLSSKIENTTKVDFKKQEEEAIEEKNKKTQDAIQRETASSMQSTGEESEESGKETKVEMSHEEEEEKVDKNVIEQNVVIEEVEEDKQDTEQTEEKTAEKVVEEIKEENEENPKLELPENVEKLVNFMKETGGTLEDYVNLNKDYSNLNNEDLLVEYYLQTKPHLNHEEINFLLDDQFAWDEEVDEERAIRKKKLALKEEIAKAKNFLESSKDKYYEELKLKPSISNEQQKAMDFFNRYNKEQEARKQDHEQFKNITNKFFSNEFKGFDFNIGEKKFKYKINNASDIANSQSDLNNFIGKFLDKNGKINDLEGYHKALYAARNADSLAKHFYEQGKTDAIKDVTAKSKNITNEVRSAPSGDIYINGMKVKAISGVDSSKLKIKTKK
tara:strand:- start:1730 stop:2962 length:1233 start_codon:yes stop_codon:yes gene_type:complete